MEDSIQAYIKSGKGYSEQKNYDLAIKQFNKALEEGCADGEVHFELGKAYYLQGMFLKAVAALEAAKRINPDNIDSSILLAKSYQALGKGECALEIFKRISNVEQVDDKARIQLFEFFRANKIYDLAIKECEKISSGKADKIISMDLLQLYNFEGEYERLGQKVSSLSADSGWQEPYLRNRLLNELEISQRKTILESKPRILLVTLTNRCNLNCYMCGRGDSDWEISPKIAEEIAGLLPYLELITWQGGEVFLTKNFDLLFEKTFGFEYLKQIVITNALLIDEGWAEKIAMRNNVGLTVSIDSVDEKIYEHIRRGAHFEQLTRNLRIINRARKNHSSQMTTTLRCTIMKANYDQLERFIEFAREYEFNVVQMAPISSDGYDPENIFNNKDRDILHHIANTAPKARKLAEEYGIKLLDWIPALDEPDAQGEKSQDAANAVGSTSVKKPVCFRPWKQIAMNVKGKIFPECLCNEPIGDAFVDSLSDVWNNEKMQSYRKGLSQNEYTGWCNPDCISGCIPPEHLKFTFI